MSDTIEIGDRENGGTSGKTENMLMNCYHTGTIQRSTKIDSGHGQSAK